MAVEGQIDVEKVLKMLRESVNLEELDIEIDRSKGRIFLKEGSNLMNYIKDGKVWVLK